MIRFDAETRTLWLPRANKVLEAKLDENYERVPGLLRWKVPPDGVTFTRGLSYLMAITSGALNPDDKTVLTRLASCLSCDALKPTPNGGWCQTCGCGSGVFMTTPDKQPAEKMLYKTLNCPKFRPGFSNALASQEGQ